MAAENLVKFRFGTLEQYNALETKDSNTIYFVEGSVAGANEYRIYKGNNLYDGTNPELVADITALRTLIGTLPTTGITATTVIGYIDEKNTALANRISNLTASDIAVTDSEDDYIGTNVEAVLAEIADKLADGVDTKTIYLQDESVGQDDYAKVYKIYQGANAPTAQNNPATLIGTINIPKDKVVQSGSVKTVTTVDTPYIGAVVGDKYIELVLQNVPDPLYIPANSLVDIYTAEQNASQIQIAIDGNNEISATIVAGSVDTTELANDAVTTAKIADDAVTADKVAIAAHSESQTAGSDGIAVTVTTTDGQVSGVVASIAAETYDAYGAAADAVAALDATVTATGTPAQSGTMVITSVTETDGKLVSVVSTEVEAAGAAAVAKSEVIGTNADIKTANTVYGAKAYADDAVSEALSWQSIS